MLPNQIVIRFVRDSQPQQVPLTPGQPLFIGSASNSDIQITEPDVSSPHARVEVLGPQVYITDLDSMAGTLLDGQRIPASRQVTWNPGSVVSVGSISMELIASAGGDKTTSIAERIGRDGGLHIDILPSYLAPDVSAMLTATYEDGGHQTVYFSADVNTDALEVHIEPAQVIVRGTTPEQVSVTVKKVRQLWMGGTFHLRLTGMTRSRHFDTAEAIVRVRPRYELALLLLLPLLLFLPFFFFRTTPPPQPTATIMPTSIVMVSPSVSPSPSPSPTPSCPQGRSDIAHTVTGGQVLARIASQYSVSIDEVVAENSLTNPNSLSVGQVLQIPCGLPGSYPLPPPPTPVPLPSMTPVSPPTNTPVPPTDEPVDDDDDDNEDSDPATDPPTATPTNTLIPLPGPDLSVQVSNTEAIGDVIAEISFSITNLGDRAVNEDFLVQIEGTGLEPQSSTTEEVPFSELSGENLLPLDGGEVVDLNWSLFNYECPYISEGPCNVTVSVDSANTITETNETNNQSSTTVDPPPTPPDLVIEILSVAQVDFFGSDIGPSLEISYSVTNQGETPITGDVLIDVEAETVSDFGSALELVGSTLLGVGSIPAGGSAEGSFSTDYSCPVFDGFSCEARVTVDPDDIFFEFDETNNTDSATFPVGPDLIISNPTIQTRGGGNLLVNLTVENIGNRSTDVSETNIDISAAGEDANGNFLEPQSIVVPPFNLDAQERIPLIIDLTDPCTAPDGSTCRILLTVDSRDIVPESSEVNNTAIATYVREVSSSADLAVTMTSNLDESNETDVVQITITNNGPDDATNIVVNDNVADSRLTIDSTDALSGEYADGTWRPATLPAGDSITLTLSVTPEDGPNPFSIEASVSGAEFDPDSSNNSTTLEITLPVVVI